MSESARTKRYITAVNPIPYRDGDDVLSCGHNFLGEIVIQGHFGQIVLTIGQAQELGTSLIYAANTSISKARTLRL